MRATILLLFMLSGITAMAQTKITEEDVLEFKQKIENEGYFNYVIDKSEIATWEKIQTNCLTQYGWLCFPSHAWIVEEETGTFLRDEYTLFDYRTILVDSDNLFRGGMEHYLNLAKQVFEIRGLKFEVRDEKMEWGEKDQENDYHYFKHEVWINDKHILIAEGNVNRMGGYMYFKKYREIIENELRSQSSDEKVSLVRYEDGVVLLIGNENLLATYEEAIQPFENKIIKE